MKIVLFFLVLIIIVLLAIACFLYNKVEFYLTKYEKQLIEHQRILDMLEYYKKEAEQYERKYIRASLLTPENINQEILEAVKYARIKSHPDNGGTMDDFVKFNECYNKLMNNARK